MMAVPHYQRRYQSKELSSAHQTSGRVYILTPNAINKFSFSPNIQAIFRRSCHLDLIVFDSYSLLPNWRRSRWRQLKTALGTSYQCVLINSQQFLDAFELLLEGRSLHPWSEPMNCSVTKPTVEPKIRTFPDRSQLRADLNIPELITDRTEIFAIFRRFLRTRANKSRRR